jgi:hypothetical protein
MKGTPFVPHNVLRYTNAGLIVRLRDNETAAIWEGRRGRKLPSDIRSFALRKLRLLNNAKRPEKPSRADGQSAGSVARRTARTAFDLR